MIRAVIFDLDGVIVDSEPARLDTYRRLFMDRYGIRVNFEDGDLIGRSEKANLQYLLSKYELDGDVNELSEIRSDYLVEIIGKDVALIPSVFDLLKYLRPNQIQSALATNSRRKYAEAVIERFGLGKYFDFTVTGEEVHEPKPNPEMFLIIAKRLRVKSRDCLVLEDSPAGIEAARTADMQCYGVLSSFKKRELKGAQGYLEKNGKLPQQLLRLFEEG